MESYIVFTFLRIVYQVETLNCPHYSSHFVHKYYSESGTYRIYIQNFRNSCNFNDGIFMHYMYATFASFVTFTTTH